MKRNHLTLLLFFLSVIQLFSQKTTLHGLVRDSLGAGLPAATVVLMQQKDSVLSSFGITENDGRFALKRVSAGEYLLQISYVGYGTHWLPVSVKPETGASLELGVITLEPVSANLAEVEVTADHVPLRLRSDTIEYNAAAFRTQPGSVVEDLLKKLPGVEVQADGSIRAQGEQVKNVLVDGKEFFGNDPQIATKNLPADAVNKVQVFDKKSDMAEFTGIEDGRDEKTINLELKEDKKHGYFGNVSAGYGSEERYEGKFNFNRFSGKTQFSLLGLMNNTGRQSFSITDYLRYMGGMESMMGGSGGSRGIRISFNPDDNPLPLEGAGLPDGFNESWAGGLNLNHEFSKKTRLNGSYFFNRMENIRDRFTTRENLLGDQRFVSEESDDRSSRNLNHRLNLTLRHEVDSFQNLILRTRLGLNDTHLSSLGISKAFDAENLPGNDGSRDYRANGNNRNFATELTFRRRFRRKGRALVANGSAGFDNNERNANLFSLNRYFQGGIPDFSDTLNQRQSYGDDATTWGANLSFTEPVGKREFLEFHAGRQNFANETRKDFFDRYPDDQELFNDSLSNRFDRGYLYDRGGVNVLVNRKKWNLTAGANLQRSKLDGQQAGETQPLVRSFTRLLPNAFFEYEMGVGHRFSFEYETNLREPSLEQLLPVVDNTDPLNTYSGNPALQPEYAHDLNAHYMLFDQFTFTNFFADFGMSYVKDRITNATTIDDFLRRNTSPVNVGRDLTLRGYLNFRTPIKPVKSNVSISLNSTWNRGNLFVNTLENTAERLTNTFDLSFDNRKKDMVDITVGARLSHNRTTYSESSALNQTWLSKRFYAEVTAYPAKKWEIGSKFRYTIYPDESFGNGQKLPIWEANISRYIFQNNRGQVRLAAYDLLNKNIGFRRNSQLNYIEQQFTPSLGRYVLLTFAYSISGFGTTNNGIEIRVQRSQED
jgi:hypothetical protein